MHWLDSRWTGGLLAGGIALAALPAQAFDLRPTVKIGYEGGGDTLVTATYTNGDTANIKAGEGLMLGVGASLLNEAKNFEIELTANGKFQFISAQNGRVTWRRFPVELLAFYRVSKFRIGGGVTYHLSPKVTGTGVASNVDHTYDPSLGYVVQADYLFSGAESGTGAYLGVRFTSIDYKLKGGGPEAGANSFGIHAGYRF